jgi:translocation and assembly module TamB
MIKRIMLIALMLGLIIPVALVGLMSSATGSRWLLQTVFANLPISVAAIDGRLLGRIQLSGLTYRSDTETLAVRNLVLAWQPGQLFSGLLKIDEIALNDLDVSLAKTAGEEKFDFNAPFRLPVRIALEKLLVTNAEFRQNESVYRLERLQASAFAEHDRLSVALSELKAGPVAATATGDVALGNGFPFNMTADWQAATADYGLWQATTTAQGNIDQLSFDNQLASPFKSALTGRLDNIRQEPRISARGEWRKINWPLDGTEPQISSEQGSLELNGLLSAYRISLSTELIQPYLPKAQLSFHGQGSTEALSIRALELKSTAGMFQLSGDVSWLDGTRFDLAATGQQFNPAMLSPELQGSLTFDSKINGKISEDSLQLNADIGRLSGQLRGYPVEASGKLAIADEQLNIDNLLLVSGPNNITANGNLGRQQASIAVAVDAPELAALWPNLGGSLKGNGRLQGALKNPDITFQADGKSVHFGEYKAEQLTVNIDYHADPAEMSAVRISAKNLKAGTAQITDTLLDGSGSLQRHRVKAEIVSVHGNLTCTLQGSVEGNAWQGELAKLDLNTRDSGRWRLGGNAAVQVGRSPAGLDIALGETCLNQKNAKLCMQGRYPANADFAFKANASHLPTSLMQPLFPEHLQLTGEINADADLKRQKKLLSGNFRLVMPANAKVILTTRQQTVETTLGASTLTGKVQDNLVTADFDLALAERDYLRGELQIENQALSGRITASVLNFTPLTAFVPQLSDFKGKLTADLALAGNIDKPVVNGAVNFTDGAADIPDLKLELRDIGIEALASTERVQLDGYAKSGAGFVKLNGYLNLQGASELKLSGTEFEIAKLPEAQIAVSPDLTAIFNGTDGKITGKVYIPKATLQLPQLPQNAIEVSSDEVILGEEKPEERKAPAGNVDADIEIVLGKDIFFSGKGLETNLSGQLKFAKTGEKMAMYGNIDMDKASYKSYGQNLTVRKGRFMFNGPVDKPWLDVEAIRVAKNRQVTAILSVSGPLDAPKTRIYSEPALPESEALAYLVTGGPLNQVSKTEGNLVASAALSYGAGKFSWMAEKLGVSEFEIKEGEQLEDTLASVGRYLTPDFYIGTEVGLFNNQAVLVLKRKLTDSINVETQTGTSQRIKLNYELYRD